jgi:putative ABC transport system permease protein
MLLDLRYAFRTLLKNPRFSLVAVLAIALGVGPNSAIFSLIDAVLLRPLPYQDADRLTLIWETAISRGFPQVPVTGPNYAEWRKQNRSFEDMAAVFMIPEFGYNVRAGGEPERVQAARTTSNLFPILGLDAVAGRRFATSDDQPSSEPSVMISYSYWQRRFGGRQDVLGRPIGLDGVNHTLIGVLPKEVDSLAKVDVWVTLRSDLALEDRNNHGYGVVGRLKAGVTLEQASLELNGLASGLEKQYPESNTGFGVKVMPIHEMIAGQVRAPLLILLAAVGLLLLIACANVASLLLARAAGRQKELAVRTAVGASRARIVRQLLTESVMLGTAGGALGLVFAWWSIGGLRIFVPDFIPRLNSMTVDHRVLLFTLGISLLTGIIFGLIPALRASRTDLNETLKEGGGKGAVGRAGTQRARTALLVTEIALCLVLLTGAGLLMRSFANLLRVDPGFRAENVLTMHVTVPWGKYPAASDRAQFTRAVLRQVEQTPGVETAAIINFLPMRGTLFNRISVMPFHVEGRPAPQKGQEVNADFRVVSPRYFSSMSIPLHAGRVFEEADAPERAAVVVVNQTLARRYFGSAAEAVGKRLVLPMQPQLRQVVGVVADVKLYSLESAVEPAIYMPYAQESAAVFSLLVRAPSSGQDVTALAPAVRRAVAQVDPDQAVADVRTMAAVLSDSLLIRRLALWMLGVFAALAFGLAVVGIYGLSAYFVSQRTREIGIRLALGAEPGQVQKMIVLRGVAVSLVGIGIGAPLALMVGPLLSGMLYGVAPQDVTVLLGAAILIALVAAAASYLPARRTLRISPVTALRYE